MTPDELKRYTDLQLENQKKHDELIKNEKDLMQDLLKDYKRVPIIDFISSLSTQHEMLAIKSIITDWMKDNLEGIKTHREVAAAHEHREYYKLLHEFIDAQFIKILNKR